MKSENKSIILKQAGLEQRIDSVTSKKITILNFLCAIMVVFIHSTGYKYFELNTANAFSGG